MKMTNNRKVEGKDVSLIVMGVIFAAAAYFLGTSYLFQIGADGSFLMYRAAQLGLVPDKWAKEHLLDVVYFKQISDGTWEYRVPRPLVGYAYLPGVVAQRTTKDLGALCGAPDPNGMRGCQLVRLIEKP
ncbi:hypothetical protein [Ralstonia pickettii]|uniref:Transmembrane protein n=1 Tax=Ralstonia pickettii TaxID=329 RepID=A0AAW4Q6A8_RALPI|nr:hypothetical protein [Ralstonia pickettii]MBA9846744.1 hypothetical protein [Ralstonia pickettii]MBA9852104.1 hypothetical protein [Ralstonia pickettii]MBA9919881.1 hypothetical protein [Ralstonia pickettii]MBA9958983.1 hypothetical protein [Ralstonia pickettii]MBA9964638.1 hypothetical protein [Ralstonia pickettii]